MSPLSVGPHAEGLGEEQVRRKEAGEALQAPTPAQVIRQVLGCDTVEVGQPSFQPAIVGVDVLDMEGVVDHPNASADIDGLVSDIELLGQGDIDGATIGAQYGIVVEDRFQDGSHRLGIGARQDRIGRCRGAVACDQYRDLFVRQPSLGRFATPFARWT